MPRIVYIATRYADAAHVGIVIVPRRPARRGSAWYRQHLPPHAPEDLSSMTAIDVIRAYGSNRAEVTAADVVLDRYGRRARRTPRSRLSHEVSPVVGRPPRNCSPSAGARVC